jgi:hypothetical protein
MKIITITTIPVVKEKKNKIKNLIKLNLKFRLLG